MRSAKGFTLLEVVVAMAVLALLLGTVYESFGWGLRRSEVVQKKEKAWLNAQSLLAALRVEKEFSPGIRESDTDAVPKWRVEIRNRKEELGGASAFMPVDVIVTVPWGPKSKEFIELKSVELASRPR